MSHTPDNNDKLRAAEQRLEHAWTNRELEPSALRGVAETVLAEFAQTSGAERLLARARLARAHALTNAGDFAEAGALADLASGEFRRLGDSEHAAWADLSRAVCAYYRSDYETARRLTEGARDAFAALANDRGQASAHSALANIARVSGQTGPALVHARHALDLFRACEHRPGLAMTLNNLGAIAHDLGDFKQAVSYFEEALKIARAMGYRRVEGFALNNIGSSCEAGGDIATALAWHRESFALKEKTGDRRGQAISLNNIGIALKKLGRHAEALEQQQRGLELFRAMEDDWGQSYCQLELGDLAAKRGERNRAREHFEQSLTLRRKIGDRRLEGEALLALAGLLLPAAADSADLVQARNCAAGALAIAEEMDVLPLRYEARRQLQQIERAAGRLEQALGHCEEAMTLEKQIARREADERLNSLRVLHEVETARLELEQERTRAKEFEAALHEAERQRQRAAAADEAKSETLRIVAHDLRNPVAAIRAVADLLVDRVQRDTEGSEYCDMIATSADEVLEMVGNLMEEAALADGDMPRERRPVDVSRILQAQVRAHAAQARLKRLRFETNVPDVLVLTANEKWLNTIFTNLISNALKFSPRNATVIVDAEREKNPDGAEAIHVTITDQGPGLNAADMERLFGKYARLSAQPTGGEPSSGLGLFLVRKLVELQHGRVWAESTGTGRGSRFHVVLPLDGTG